MKTKVKSTRRSKTTKTKTNRKISTNGRDYTKMIFEGNAYGKGKLVLKVVEKYIEKNPNVTVQELKKIFGDTHPLGTIQSLDKAKELSKNHKRFNWKSPFKLGRKMYAVCSDFGKNNIGKFLDRAASLGFQVKSAA